jgi:putative tryptophan/tyrosine transport system substrate-binding protein
MRRREFVTLVGASAALPFAALAQQPGRTYRFGMLYPAVADPVMAAFLEGLRHHGFTEGQNLTVDYRLFARQIDLVSDYAAELVKTRVDVIAAGGPFAIRAAQEATKTIPILGIADDMIGSGLVHSMAHPDGNTTGISILATELDGKRQEILVEAVPQIRRMATLADTNTTPITKLQVLQEAAAARNIALSIHQITRGEEIAAAIDMAKGSGATALNVLASPLLFANRQLIIDSVAALGLPAIYEWPEMAEEGGLVAYGPRLIDIYRDLQARQLAQLLRGVKSADIPIEQPTKFELWINLKTAKAMGVTVPEALLVRADKVIE